MPEKKNDYSLIEQIFNLLNTQGICAPSEAGKKISAREARTAAELKQFFDELPCGFLIYKADSDERILYANKSLARIFQCHTVTEFREYTGNSFKGIAYTEDHSSVQQSVQNQFSLHREDLAYAEFRIKNKDGIIRWVEGYGHFAHCKSVGDIYYVFISDATEKINRRMLEKTGMLHESSGKEQALLNLIEEYDKEHMLIRQEHLQRLEVIEGLSVNYDSILYVNLDTDTVLPYRLSTRLERQFEKKFQPRPFQWFLNDYVNVWVHPEDSKRVAELTSVANIRKKLSEDKTFYVNYRCIENNETKYLQLRLVNVGAENTVSQVVMGYRNIDVEILQELKQKKLLEEALNGANLAYVAKNTFLSNMSHDMRTPLNAIFGFTSLARKTLNDPTATEEYLRRIETAGNQILDLVNRVLEISYMESQDFHLNRMHCSIGDLMQTIRSELSEQAKKKNIDVSLNLALNNDGICTDKDKLYQILIQIAGNAVKYTEAGGKVYLRVEESAQSGALAYYRFIIEDTGIGIGEEARRHIFEPFEREKNTTFSGTYGSGLGLTIAKHLVDMMGGTIELESTVGKGSTFTVSLSFLTNEPQDDEEPRPTPERTATDYSDWTILVVEDNEINLEIETEMLQDAGFKVDTAVNGLIAVDKVKNSKPGDYALVLMDIQMPIMDGRQATAAIRKLKNQKLAHIPIIALSANAFESDKKISMEIGMDAHLTKPIDVPTLIQTIADTITNSKQYNK